ncbi:MAG: NADP-dependent malic enzyme [Rhodospirillaceae bacterium]|nr:NADP-dependent malic enzyme [Rhodospirillaceae bacterium]
MNKIVSGKSASKKTEATKSDPKKVAPRARRNFDQEALAFHANGRPGKIEITPTKPLTTQHDLSLAYSPGVAAPCLEIARDPATAYDYTAKGNLVAVISNGTAVLGLGDLGALASKPVMEGKAVLFKRFADVDGIDLEIDTRDVDEFVNCVRFLGPSFGGINLEDIKAPECFVIESRLREIMDIPVFHDDQHGTAIISVAGLINACDLTGRKMSELKLVVNGAGAAAISCLELAKALGVKPENALMVDSKGVIYKGRKEGMNQWKSAHAADTKLRTLAEALDGADAFLGLSVKGAVTPEMVKKMAKNPIIFAMANPDPEITPEEVAEVRDDVIIATGRSDYPNQVNNVLGFPFIFRGALDVRARTINEDMKIAAAQALANLARENVPDEVAAAYAGRKLRYGREYIIPVPFDPRLISTVPPAVAEAAMKSGVARKPIEDMNAYRRQLAARRDPTVATLQSIAAEVTRSPRTVVFAEGEEERSIRAAVAYRNSGYGKAVLVARRRKVEQTLAELAIKPEDLEGITITNARESTDVAVYTDYLYKRLQRQGQLYRDCERMVSQDRNIFAACMVALGHADTVVTGLTRNYHSALTDVRRVIDTQTDSPVFGLTMVVVRGRTLFIADTAVHERPTADEVAQIAVASAAAVRRLGHDPKVALLSYSNFGNPPGAIAETMRDATKILESAAKAGAVNFEFDGEMSVDAALDPDRSKIYPFCKLTGPANVLVMPGLHAANISTRLVQHFGAATSIGPMLLGLQKPVQIVSMNATVSDLVQMALMAAHASAPKLL